MEKVYFAHPVNSYNTLFEKAILELLKAFFPDCEIENPNHSRHQAGYKEYAERFKHEPLASGTRGMRYFHEIVLPGCKSSSALPFLDGRLGLGVADESRWYLKRGLPAWFIEPLINITPELLADFTERILRADATVMSEDIFQIRLFTPEEAEMLLSADPESGNKLVLSHEETRLRTFITYGKIMRPYELAHMVSLPIPEGFYPKKEGG